MSKSIITGIILLASFTSFAEPEIKGTATELAQFLNGVPKIIVVAGEAEVRVPAHRAVLSLKVVTENKSLQGALRANLELRNALADYLKGLGIPAERIQASKFSSTPKFGIFSEKAKSYRVENVMSVSVQDEKEFQGVAGAVDKWNDVQFIGVEFEYADKELQKQNAIAKACDNANDQKKIYEGKFGLKLTPVGFGQNEVMQRNVTPKNYYGTRSYGVTPVAEVAVSESIPEAATAGDSVLSFGEIIYTAKVAVEYTVQQK
jgi:hypothetical protein